MPVNRLKSSIELYEKTPEPLHYNGFGVARREGFEPPAFWSVARRSIQLS